MKGYLTTERMQKQLSYLRFGKAISKEYGGWNLFLQLGNPQNFTTVI